jgi:hypothetical protein
MGVSLFMLKNVPGYPSGLLFIKAIGTPGSAAHAEFSKISSKLLNRGIFQKTYHERRLDTFQFVIRTARNHGGFGPIATVINQIIFRNLSEECFQAIHDKGGISMLPTWEGAIQQYTEPDPMKVLKRFLPKPLALLKEIVDLYGESSHAKCHQMRCYYELFGRPFEMNLAVETALDFFRNSSFYPISASNTGL